MTDLSEMCRGCGAPSKPREGSRFCSQACAARWADAQTAHLRWCSTCAAINPETLEPVDPNASYGHSAWIELKDGRLVCGHESTS